jgi:hypothetical protein
LQQSSSKLVSSRRVRRGQIHSHGVGLGSQLISLLGTSQVAYKEDSFEYALQVPLAEAVRGTEDPNAFATGMPR